MAALNDTFWPHNVKVLIVDDDTEQRQGLGDLLKKSGYIVLEAANGKEGLELCRTAHPSIVLLDAVMPVMDGIAFLIHKRLNRDIVSIPVVMLTAWNVGAIPGVVSVLRKPAPRRAIVSAVRSFAMSMG